MSSPRIFISYRRDDSPGSAGRLYDRLVEEFPKENLFMDVDAIAPGVDFISEIERSVAGCDVLLAIIGRNWATATDAQGRRRLDDPNDFVRNEIATALTSDVRVIPVLVDGAAVPASTDLPDDLQPLVRRNAVVLSHQHFTAETRALARSLAADAVPEAPRPWRASDADVRGVDSAPAARVAGATQSVSLGRALGASATLFAIVGSGAVGGLVFAREGPEYWYLRVDRTVQVWVALNLMVGPALVLKLWLPRFGTQHFWGVVGATFAALVTLNALQLALQAMFLPDASGHPAGIAEMLLAMGLIHTPSALGAGLVLGYFLAQALRGWFPHDGGRGFVRRMILIWMSTGALYAVSTFVLIAVAEAAAARKAAEAGPAAREYMRVWTDSVVFGLSWALGLFLTLRVAPRSGAQRSA